MQKHFWILYFISKRESQRRSQTLVSLVLNVSNGIKHLTQDKTHYNPFSILKKKTKNRNHRYVSLMLSLFISPSLPNEKIILYNENSSIVVRVLQFFFLYIYISKFYIYFSPSFHTYICEFKTLILCSLKHTSTHIWNKN